MSKYETDMIKLIKQIAEDIRWLRQRADRIKKRDDQELLERIEQTHRGPKKTSGSV